MPVLDLRIRRSGFEATAQPRSTPAQYGGQGFEAIGELGTSLQKQAAEAEKVRAEIAKGEQELAANSVLSKLKLDIDEANRRLESETDHTTYLPQATETLSRFARDAETEVKTFDPAVRNGFSAALNRLTEQFTISARDRQKRLEINHGRAETLTVLTNAAKIATESEDPAVRQQWMAAGFDQLDRAKARGFIDNIEYVQEKERFTKGIAEGRQAFFTTGLQTKLDNLSNRSFRDPINASNYEAEGFKAIDAAGGDWLPKQKIAEAKMKFRDQLWTGAIKSKVMADPVSTKKELLSGDYDDKIDQQSLLSLTDMADNEIERLRREAEARRKEGLREIGKAVTDFKEAKMLGFDWAGNESQLAAAVRGTEHEAEFNFVRQASKALNQFNKLAPVEQEAELRALAGKPMTGDGAKFASTLSTAHEKTKTGLKQDPISFAIKQRSVPGVGPLDLNNPVSLKERSIIAGMVQSRYGLGAISPLSDDEASKLVTDMAKAPADQKAQTMRQLNQYFTPQQVQAVAAQIDKKGQGELAQAFGMSGQVPEVTSRILQGMEAKRANKEVLPVGVELRDMDAAINKKLADAYKADPNALDSVRDAVKSYYAWGRWNVGDLSAKLDGKALDRAIYAVTGGVMDFNGAQTLPPRYGVNEAQMRKMIEKADFSQVLGGINAKTVLNSGRLIAVGPGLYRVIIGGAPVFDKNQKPFTLDLNRLVEVPK